MTGPIPGLSSEDTPTPDPSGSAHAPDAIASTAAALPLDGLASGSGMLPGLPAARRYTFRFAVSYIGLGVVFAASVAGLVVLLFKPGHHASAPWSSWKPSSGSTANVSTQIGNHIAPTYTLDKKGAQIVAVVAGPTQVTSGTHKVSVSRIAVRKKANSNTGIQISASGSSWTYQLCGLGPNCSISTGHASETRGRLVRREALELALYTFKYVPAVTSVIAFMPPPPGQTATTLVYLQKANLSAELSQPLRKTLPLAKPPLPSDADPKEAATIDKLTLPAVYSYSLLALQDNSAMLVLDPVAS